MTTFTQGDVLPGAAEPGDSRPVKVGGVFNTIKPTLSNGQRGDLQLTVRGFASVALHNPAGDDAITALADNADGVATNSNATRLAVSSRPYSFNGSTFDRQRNNSDLTLLASAARTATLQSSDQTNYNGRGLHVVLDVTSAGTGSITLTIQAKDVLSGKYYTLLAGAAVTTNSTNVYKVYPGLTAAANVSANDLLPRTWRIEVVHNNANSITYSVGCSVVL